MHHLKTEEYTYDLSAPLPGRGPDSRVRVEPGEVCPLCQEQKLPTLQDHECDDECGASEHRSIRCILQIVPEPGEDCALCEEQKPNEHALYMRKWRAKKRG